VRFLKKTSQWVASNCHSHHQGPYRWYQASRGRLKRKQWGGKENADRNGSHQSSGKEGNVKRPGRCSLQRKEKKATASKKKKNTKQAPKYQKKKKKPQTEIEGNAVNALH